MALKKMYMSPKCWTTAQIIFDTDLATPSLKNTGSMSLSCQDSKHAAASKTLRPYSQQNKSLWQKSAGLESQDVTGKHHERDVAPGLWTHRNEKTLVIRIMFMQFLCQVLKKKQLFNFEI